MRSILWLALLSTSVLLVTQNPVDPEAGRERDRRASSEAAEVDDAGRPEGAFDEDEDRIREVWESAMTPEEYQNALLETGMASARLGGGALQRGGGWYSIGPVGGVYDGGGNSMNKWNGRIACIGTMNTAGGYHIYVGGSSGGFWRAHIADGNGVWTSLGDNLPNPSVRAFSVNPDNVNDIVVGTGDRGRVGGSGMYRTLDGGGTWSQVSLPVMPKSFARIDRSPTNANVLVAACMSPGGILRSVDGGATWASVLSGAVNDLVVDPNNFNIQYAAVDILGAFKSINAGVTWTNMNVPLPAGVPFNHGFLAVCRGATQHVALFLSQADAGEGIQGYQVLRSTNSGSTWTNITGTLGGWHMAEFHHTGAICFRPNNPDEIYVGARGFLQTTDNGANWNTVLDTHADITQLRFFDQSGDNFIWICMDGGVVGRTIGGAAENWNGDASTGLRCSQVDFLDAKRNLRTIGLQDNGVDYSTNTGSTWISSIGGDGVDCEIVNDLTNEFWHSAWGFSPAPGTRVHRQKSSGLTFTNHTADEMDGLFYSRFGNMMYSIGDDDLVYRCDVGGSPLSWIAVAQTPAQWSVGRTPTGSYVDGNTMYANVAGNPIVLIARLNGNWTVQNYNFGGSGSVQNIYPSTENAAEAWVTMSRSSIGQALVFHTRDYGVSWTDVTGNLTSLKLVRCLVQKPFEPHTLWVGTDIGVFETLDSGTSWHPLQDGLPIVPCTDLRYVVDPSHGGSDKLVVSTYGRGIYECPVWSFGIVYVDPNSPRTTEDGTYDHPYDTFNEGRNALPAGASLGLHGNGYTTGPITFSTPMTLRAYGGPATLGL